MTRRNRSRITRGLTVALSAAAVAALSAGSHSTTLSNGASLSVSVTSPLTGTEFEVPPGQPGIDVPVSGGASVGIGEPDNTFLYVLDSSGSTGLSSGAACGTILNCEKQFFIGLNSAVAADGSTDEVGFIDFGAATTIHDLNGGAPGPFTTPLNPAVNGAINSLATAIGATNCSSALAAAASINGFVTNGHKTLLFASDGVCNTGGAVGPVVATLEAQGWVIDSVAIGSASSCSSDGGFGLGTLNDITANGGTCTHVVNIAQLPDVIDNLTGTTLTALDMTIDGGAAQTVTGTSLPLPQPGAIGVTYTANAAGLAPGQHEICVTAHGSDVTGGTAATTQCETIQLVQLSAAPAEATNELGSDHSHTVTATLSGDASAVTGRAVNFAVGGQNAGAAGTCNPASCETDGAGQVSFTYEVPVAPSSLGTDTITAATEIGGHATSVSVLKHWVDTTPPTAACTASVNPAGNMPQAGNPPGFFVLTGGDAVDPSAAIYVRDTGSGQVFGPFASGTHVKYTQAPGATPSISPMTGAVDWQIKGTGDMQVYATDGSGNTSAVATCAVPPGKK